MIIKGKEYYYKNYRIERSTAKKLNRIKKKTGKTWDKIFNELIDLYNLKN